MYVCLWSPDWWTGGEPDDESRAEEGRGEGVADLAPLLSHLAPRIRVEREVLWADGRGLNAGRLAERMIGALAELDVLARAGVAAVPLAAELAARWGAPTREGEGPTPFLVKERTGWGWRKTDLRPATTGSPAVSGTTRPRKDSTASTSPAPSVSSGSSAPCTGPGPGPGGAAEAAEAIGVAVTLVPPGRERSWLAGLPVSVLGPADRLRTLLDGVGVHTLGALAALEREAVEVRLGPAAVDLWRLARCDDRRVLFDRIPPERPHGSIDFVDYVLTDPSRLLFTANALLGPLCDGMVGRGEHARALRLTLPLANGETWARTLRPARPTASRDTWLRLIREVLDRLTVPDAVAGMRLEVGDTEEAAVRQGDLFDRGFATAAAVEAAVARLAERQVHPLRVEATAHPLVERRTSWSTASSSPPGSPAGAGLTAGSGGGSAGLTLQLLPHPRRVGVETVMRRDHRVPVRIRDRRGWREVAVAAGPDRISGGQWEGSSYAREYYRCVTDEEVLLWLYRDALDGHWYLHGWWD